MNCTHPDGHNHSGNIHVHIVIGSIRMREVERKPYMQKPRDWREGMKHSSTAQTMRHLRVEVMEQQTVTVAVLNCINYYRSLQRKKEYDNILLYHQYRKEGFWGVVASYYHIYRNFVFYL